MFLNIFLKYVKIFLERGVNMNGFEIKVKVGYNDGLFFGENSGIYYRIILLQ